MDLSIEVSELRQCGSGISLSHHSQFYLRFLTSKLLSPNLFHHLATSEPCLRHKNPS